MAGWQSGHAAACKAAYAGSIPTSASIANFEKAPLWRFFFARNLGGKFASHRGLGVTCKPAEAERCISDECTYLTLVFLRSSKKTITRFLLVIPAKAGMTLR